MCTSTEHALGNIRKKDVQKIHKAADWLPRFAFTHVFHHYLESHRHLFTRGDFTAYVFRANEGATLIGNEIRSTIKDIVPNNNVGQANEKLLR